MGLARLLLVALLVLSTETLNHSVINFIVEYFSLRGVRELTTFTCSANDSHRLSRALHVRLQFRVFSASQQQVSVALEEVARHTFYKYGVFLDHTCSAGEHVLRLNSERLFLNTSYHWLVWGGAHADLPPPQVVQTLNLSVDSEVTWAAGHVLYDLHKVNYTWPAVTTRAGGWSRAGGVAYHLGGYKYHRRKDLQGLVFRAGLVVNNIPIENLEEELQKPENRNKDAMATFNYAVYKFLIQQFNFSLQIFRTHWFGYVVENGRYEGLVKMIAEGEVDVHVSSIGLNRARYRHMDVTSYGPIFRICSIFRHPPVIGGLDAMLRPFSYELWFCSAATWGAFMLVLRFVSWTHSKLRAASDDDISTSWSDAFMAIMGTVGQQAISLDSKWVTWRVVFFVLLLVTLLIDTYYSASIVFSLITEPPKTIRTVKDLINSELEFAVENLSYNIPFFQMNDDPLVHELYVKKMLGARRTQPVNYSRQEGIRKVLNEKFAFHSEPANVYPIIAATFPDPKKCSLTEIQVIPIEICYMPVRWKSPYKEIITYGLRKVAETGLLYRLNSIWRPPKPRCFSGGGDFVPVAIHTVVPAFAILLCGAIGSATVLLLEQHWFKRSKK